MSWILHYCLRTLPSAHSLAFSFLHLSAQCSVLIFARLFYPVLNSTIHGSSTLCTFCTVEDTPYVRGDITRMHLMAQLPKLYILSRPRCLRTPWAVAAELSSVRTTKKKEPDGVCQFQPPTLDIQDCSIIV